MTRISYILDMIELMVERETTEKEPFYSNEEILREYENGKELLSGYPKCQIRLLESRKSFKIRNDLDALDDVEALLQLEDHDEVDEGDEQETKNEENLEDEIEQVQLPQSMKKTSANGKPWWDAGRNRLGETELQRRVIDLKLTNEPHDKIAIIEDLIKVKGRVRNA